MEDNVRSELTKELIELKGYIKDAALRIRTGLDGQCEALAKLTAQLETLNDRLERLSKAP